MSTALVERVGKLTGARAMEGPADDSGPAAVLEHTLSRQRPDRCEGTLPGVARLGRGDAEVYQRTTLASAAPGDVVRWEWIGPDGALAKASQVVVRFQGRGCVWDGLELDPDQAGRWQVRVLVNQEPVAADSFAYEPAGGTVEAHGRLVRQNLHLLFTGMVRLGFAVIRALCAGPATLSGDVLALMQEDLTGLENTLRPASAVIRYDASRVRALRDRLPGMTGDAAVAEISRLFDEIVLAVRAARVSCHAGAAPELPPPVWEGVTVAAYRMGIVVSLAACINCNQPLPDDLAAYMRSQLDAARAELLPYADCLQGFSFSQFNNVRLGAPYASLVSYVDLTALYVNVDQVILSNDCTCDSEGASAPATGTVRGAVRNAANGQAIAGAAVSIAGTALSATTGGEGSFTLSDAPAGAQTLRASAQGFLATEVPVTVTAGQTVTQNVSLSPVLQSGEIRITLNWTKDANRRPNDLDMHLSGPMAGATSCFHVYYNNTGSLTAAPYAQLEVDNINAPGDPPTETIRLSRQAPGLYRFWVHNYSREAPDGLAQSRATIQVFRSTGLAASFTAPAASGLYWSVFTMDGQSGQITAVNQMQGSEPPITPCR